MIGTYYDVYAVLHSGKTLDLNPYVMQPFAYSRGVKEDNYLRLLLSCPYINNLDVVLSELVENVKVYFTYGYLGNTSKQRVGVIKDIKHTMSNESSVLEISVLDKGNSTRRARKKKQHKNTTFLTLCREVAEEHKVTLVVENVEDKKVDTSVQDGSDYAHLQTLINKYYAGDVSIWFEDDNMFVKTVKTSKTYSKVIDILHDKRLVSVSYSRNILKAGVNNSGTTVISSDGKTATSSGVGNGETAPAGTADPNQANRFFWINAQSGAITSSAPEKPVNLLAGKFDAFLGKNTPQVSSPALPLSTIKPTAEKEEKAKSEGAASAKMQRKRETEFVFTFEGNFDFTLGTTVRVQNHYSWINGAYIVYKIDDNIDNTGGFITKVTLVKELPISDDGSVKTKKEKGVKNASGNPADPNGTAQVQNDPAKSNNFFFINAQTGKILSAAGMEDVSKLAGDTYNSLPSIIDKHLSKDPKFKQMLDNSSWLK